jgi:hypothetical protein
MELGTSNVSWAAWQTVYNTVESPETVSCTKDLANAENISQQLMYSKNANQAQHLSDEVWEQWERQVTQSKQEKQGTSNWHASS